MTEKTIAEIPGDVILEVNNEKQKKFKHIVDHKSITIGRDEDCNLKILDGHVSGQQCQVVYRHGHFTVIDLGSLNKTRVNDKVYVQKNLTDGDVISIGKTKITFHGPEDVE